MYTIPKNVQSLQRIACKDDTRFNISGVYFDEDVAVATNGHMMIISSLDENIETRPNKGIVKFTSATQRSKNPEIYDQVGNRLIGKFDARNAAEIVDGEFVDYKQVLPKTDKESCSVSIDAAYLLELAKCLNHESKDSKVNITFESKNERTAMLVTGNNSDVIGLLMPVIDEHEDAHVRLTRIVGDEGK